MSNNEADNLRSEFGTYEKWIAGLEDKLVAAKFAELSGWPDLKAYFDHAISEFGKESSLDFWFLFGTGVTCVLSSLVLLPSTPPKGNWLGEWTLFLVADSFLLEVVWIAFLVYFGTRLLTIHILRE